MSHIEIMLVSMHSKGKEIQIYIKKYKTMIIFFSKSVNTVPNERLGG